MRVETDEELIVADEELTSLAPLKKAMGSAQLQHLSVAFNRLTELNGLQHALALRNLNLMHNELTCIREVASLTKLRLLRCGYNQIADLRWLSPLADLRELWVQQNQIEMPQLEHLRPLTQLRVLVLHPNPCTLDEATYRARVVRMLPWLESLDAITIDQPLRDQAAQEEADERAVSVATDIAEQVLAMHTEPLVAEVVTPRACSKQSKKQSAEDFFRDFPVQEYIPVESNISQAMQQESNNNSDSTAVAVSTTSAREASVAVSTTNEHSSPNGGSEGPELSPAAGTDTNEKNDEEEQVEEPPTQLSAIASAVLSLPIFGSDSILKRKAPSVPILRKKPAPAKPTPATVSVESIQQQEWVLPYPNSTANAILIRSDGSAIAKWPSGSVAVSIDREGEGFRIYAAHKDGPVALSLDSHGVGFLNYYPSGRTMLSTTSAGDGLYFSNDGYSIMRQWDAQRCIRDENFQPIDSLGEEADGSLLCRLNDSLAVRVQLQPPANDGDPSTGSGNPLLVSVYFAPISDIRHVFVNAVNRSAAASLATHNVACDSVFGSVKSLRGKAVKKELAAVASHSEILSGIRAAVANL